MSAPRAPLLLHVGPDLVQARSQRQHLHAEPALPVRAHALRRGTVFEHGALDERVGGGLDPVGAAIADADRHHGAVDRPAALELHADLHPLVGGEDVLLDPVEVEAARVHDSHDARVVLEGDEVDASLLSPVDVLREDVLDRALGHDLALVEHDPAVAQGLDGGQVVGHEQNGRSGLNELVHPRHASILEHRVADRERLVDDEDLRLEVRSDREAESQLHPRRVVLDLCVDRLLELRERHDVVEAATDLPARDAEDAPVEPDVLAAGELEVHA